MAMASAIATVARVSGNRFHPCFGTGFTARLAVGQRPMTIAALGDYLTALRTLLAGRTATVDNKPVRMMHFEGLAADRAVDVPLWLSAFGPKGTSLAVEVADGVIGPPNAGVPASILVSGTVLSEGEDPDSERVREAIGPWKAVELAQLLRMGRRRRRRLDTGRCELAEVARGSRTGKRKTSLDLRGPCHSPHGSRSTGTRTGHHGGNRSPGQQSRIRRRQDHCGRRERSRSSAAEDRRPRVRRDHLYPQRAGRCRRASPLRDSPAGTLRHTATGTSGARLASRPAIAAQTSNWSWWNSMSGNTISPIG